MTDKDPLGIVGELIAGKYRIECLVGEGGFAVVYRALHVVWEKPVAVKLFSGLSQAPVEARESLQREFVREGALLTELSTQSAGIVQAWDVGTYQTPIGQWMPYMVLEWLEGSALDKVLDHDRALGMVWAEDQVLGFLKRILPILEVAHDRGISHRDIKPANIFVLGSAARSPATVLKLLDFGVAKMVSEHTKTSAAMAKTELAVTSFTPRYGAPEQFTRSYGATGPWTDVYSLALVVSEMLVGKNVLDGEDVIQLGFSTANPDRRPTPGAFGVRISDSFEAVLNKALAVQPEDRFADAGEFLRACVAVAQERGGSGRPGSPQEPVRPFSISESPTLPRRVLAELATIDSHPTERASSSTIETPKPRESVLGVTLLVLVVLAGATVVYSATDLRGAPETRAIILALARSGKEKVVQWLPSSRREPRPARSTAIEPVAGIAPPPPARNCPEGMRSVAMELDASTASCVDERPVRETDYAACPSCKRPRAAHHQVKAAGGSPSKYCLGAGPPAAETLECAVAEQAAAFCKHRGARLPTPEELAALAQLNAPAASQAPEEWTTPLAKAATTSRAQHRAFRCVLADGR